MASPIGTNIVNSLSRRYIVPQVVDNVYNSNALTYRLLRRKKKIVAGGTQIEQPIAWSHFAAGGYYSGFDLLDVTPSDTVKNAAFDWKQMWVPVSIDGATIVRANSDEAVVSLLGQYFSQAQSEGEDLLGTGVFGNSVTNAKSVDGLPVAIDNGAVAATYGGLARSANTFWNSQVSSAVAPLTFAQMQTIFGNCTQGGQRPTIIVTTQPVYNIVWALSTGVNSTSGVPGQAFPAQAGGEDVQLAQAGFSNILFNGVPLLVDSHCGAGNMYFVNEFYFQLYVQPQRDFYLRDFDAPVNQDAWTSLLLWMGNLCCSNVLRQGLLKGVTA